MSMRNLPLYVSLLVASVWAAPAEAQFLFRKPRATAGATSAPAPTSAAQRVGELIGAAQAGADERKRVQAIGTLRNFDANSHPEVAAVLADLARSDKSAAVRQEAIESLAALRPTSQLAGETLEWSAANDSSWRVRWEAKTSLLRYNLAGYSKTTPPEGPGATGPSTQEPPLLEDGPRGFAAPPSRPPSVQLPPRVESPSSRPMSEVNPASPAPSQPAPGFLSRILPTRKAPAPAPPPGSPAPAPTANQQRPSAPTPPPPLLETPPPIVIQTPPPGARAPTPGIPNIAQSKTTPPPRSVKGGDATQPIFRPAGQPAPRPGPGFTTAEPQRRNPTPVAPPPAPTEEIPLLIPPM